MIRPNQDIDIVLLEIINNLRTNKQCNEKNKANNKIYKNDITLNN